MFLNIFQKNEKKDYLKRIGVKFSKDEKQEIKKMIKSNLTLEQFKLCITPVLNEEILQKRSENNLDDSKWEKLMMKKLDVNQMKEIRKGFERGLSEEDVELYVKSGYDSKTMEKIRNMLEKDKDNEYLREYLMLKDKKEIRSITNEKLEKYIEESKMNELRNKADKMEKWYEASIYAGKNTFKYYSSEKIRDDEKYVTKKVKENAKNLEYASERLKNNRDLVLEAVKQDGRALQFASEELKNDKEVVIESVKNYPNSYQYASSEMQKDGDVVTEVLKRNEDALSYGDENIKQEIEEIKEKYKDSDFDGLTDREEKFVYGTNPYSKDTDLDGKNDYEEIKINYTNPKIKSKDIEIER